MAGAFESLFFLKSKDTFSFPVSHTWLYLFEKEGEGWEVGGGGILCPFIRGVKALLSEWALSSTSFTHLPPF